MRLHLQPVTLREAQAFIHQHHRHLKHPPRGQKFSIALNDGQDVVGVIVVGRPLSRRLQEDTYAAEVLRCCVAEGVKNGCSKLYAAAWRAARAMGYRKLITYTLPEEGGTSLRAAGWRVVGNTRAESWHRRARPRVDMTPAQKKLRWEIA